MGFKERVAGRGSARSWSLRPGAQLPSLALTPVSRSVREASLRGATEPNLQEPSAPLLRLPEAEELRCHRYSSAKLVLTAAELSVLLLALAALTFSGGAAALLRFSVVPGWPAWADHLVFLLMVGTATRAAMFPFHFLGEHWLD